MLPMKQMPAGEFKARCLAVMDSVQATGVPVVITRGAPVVKLVPAEEQLSDVFGFMAGEFRIVGDIQSPVVPLEQWRALKETRKK